MFLFDVTEDNNTPIGRHKRKYPRMGAVIFTSKAQSRNTFKMGCQAPHEGYQPGQAKEQEKGQKDSSSQDPISQVQDPSGYWALRKYWTWYQGYPYFYPKGPPPPSLIPPQVGTYYSWPITYPSVPYIGPVPKLQDGTLILIQGAIPFNCNRFYINLSMGPQLNEKVDTALHVNPRFEGTNPKVVRNSFLNGKWSSEEVAGPMFPLTRGHPFACTILTTNQHFRIAFNGQHFCEFCHRIPKERVSHLVIDGDVGLQSINFHGPGIGPPSPTGTGYVPPSQYPFGPPLYSSYPAGPMWPGGMMPPTDHPGPSGLLGPLGPTIPQGPPDEPANLEVPLTHPIDGGLYPGRMLHISGVPNPSKPKSFEINFKLGDGPKSDVAFKFSPHFKEKRVVMNTKRGGSWGKEERYDSNFPFSPGEEFDVVILCDFPSYKIAVNKNYFADYQHRVTDLLSISWLEVTGDVRLTNVKSFNHKKP